MEMPQVYRPVPRRAFEITPASTDSSMPPSPASEAVNNELLAGQKSDSTPSRTRSILNLTSSTLLGIYSPISDGNKEELSTPWGTGAQTPIQGRSVDDSIPHEPSLTWPRDATKPRLKQKRKDVIPILFQTILLFAFGIGYGSIVTHLHKTQRITPVPVPDVERSSLWYLVSWGVFGIVLGNALPLVDAFWETTVSTAMKRDQATQSRKSDAAPKATPDGTTASDSGLGPMWYSAVRSVGVFVGIAFAVVSCSFPFKPPED